MAERATSRNTAISLPRSDLMEQHLLKNKATILSFCKNTLFLMGSSNWKRTDMEGREKDRCYNDALP
jgi:hypothetical protein